MHIVSLCPTHYVIYVYFHLSSKLISVLTKSHFMLKFIFSLFFPQKIASLITSSGSEDFEIYFSKNYTSDEF